MVFCRHWMNAWTAEHQAPQEHYQQPQHKACWVQPLPPENFLLLHWTPITETLPYSPSTSSRPLLSNTSCCSSSPKSVWGSEGQGQIIAFQQILLTSLRKAETVSLPTSAFRKNINNPSAFKSVMKKKKQPIINRAEILNLSMKMFHALNILIIHIHWTWKLTKTAAGWMAQLGHTGPVDHVQSAFT